jgi:uncharacterized membrane protein (UPF0182 family)
MFETAQFILIALGIYFLITGILRRKPKQKWGGGILALLSIFVFWWMGFWGEKLWFDANGYNDRFWTLFLFRTGFTLAGGLLSAVLVGLLTFSVPRTNSNVRKIIIALAALIGGFWGNTNWKVFLKSWYRVDTGITDPIFEKDVSFYLFSLPFYDQLYSIALTISFLAIAASFFLLFEINPKQGGLQLRTNQSAKHLHSLFLSSGTVLLTWAFGKYLDRYHLMFSDTGTVSGPGWTDVNIKLPILSVLIVTTLILALTLWIGPARKYLSQRILKLLPMNQTSPIYALGFIGIFIWGLYTLGLDLIPYVFQEYRVEPNEITFEKPFIANNIEFTRKAYKLDVVEEKEFEASETFTPKMVSENPSIFNNIRLWDWRAMDNVLKQFQEIRLYYEFKDVDVDRYHYNGKYNQVMISAREMKSDNLPPESQTFVNEHFKYTHGYGVAMATVSDFTAEGLPNFLIQDIPPKSKFDALEVEQPEIYYGELTNDYVIVNSTEKEFDYPSGSQNVYNNYKGDGGVQISSFWRKLIYSYKLGGTQLLLSSYPSEESRIMFRRNIGERIRSLAPFLKFENDPYIVSEEGKLYWMIDAYTTSEHYPYSEAFAQVENVQYEQGNFQRSTQMLKNSFRGVNYIRNSVKAVVNAYDGKVSFYIFDEEDPIIKVWNRIFPGLFKQRAEMPSILESHVRYPSDYLMAQGLVYAKYHMTDPEVFYNQEDLWIPATEKYYNSVIPVQPYYIMWGLPGSEEPQFSLILPFTPKNRQVLIGWVAGLCDPGNYGRFLAYNFPKEKRVLGPQQVETKIDQDSFLSGQLSLWDQRGSNVIRGNVLAIPVGNTLIYVEPIYLKAETAAYPELRLVCIMHEDNLSYGETFDIALEGLFKTPDSGPGSLAVTSSEKEGDTGTNTLIELANRAFNNYLEATGQGRFGDAAEELNKVKEYLQRLSEGTEENRNE